MADRPGLDIATTAGKTFDGTASIDDQVGFYDQAKQPHLDDINSRVGQEPAQPDGRFTNVPKQ
jgi:hypothetical protein